MTNAEQMQESYTDDLQTTESATASKKDAPDTNATEEIPWMNDPALADAYDTVENNTSEEQKASETRAQTLHIVKIVIPTILLLVALVAVIYFIVYGVKSEYTSDYADTILWSYATYESGSPLNEDFSYACLLPFAGNLIMLPYVALFGISWTAQACGMLTFMVLFVAFFFLMLHEMGWHYSGSCLAISLFLAMTLSSEKLREMFWGHTIYYSLGILFLLIGTYLYFRLSNLEERMYVAQKNGTVLKSDKIHLTVTTICLLLFILLSSTDGTTSLSLFTLPFMAGILAEQVLDSRRSLVSRENVHVYLQLVIFAIFVILGLWIQSIWAGDLIGGYESAYSKYAEEGYWADNLQSFLWAWLDVLGVEYIEGSLMSLESIPNLLRILSGLLLLVFPIIATCYYTKYPQTREGKYIRIWIWIHWAVTVIILLGYVFGLLSSSNWRITPIIGTSLIVTLLFLRYALSTVKPANRLAALLAVPMILVSGYNSCTIYAETSDYYTNNILWTLANTLEDMGYTYGYATFWNAGALTVISDSEVEVRNVTVDENGVSIYNYQTLSDWYVDQPGQEDYFLLLEADEYTILNDIGDTLLDEAIDTSIITIDSTEYYVLLFDENIF